MVRKGILCVDLFLIVFSTHYEINNFRIRSERENSYAKPSDKQMLIPVLLQLTQPASVGM